jgi:hypothetical protein
VGEQTHNVVDVLPARTGKVDGLITSTKSQMQKGGVDGVKTFNRARRKKACDVQPNFVWKRNAMHVCWPLYPKKRETKWMLTR